MIVAVLGALLLAAPQEEKQGKTVEQRIRELEERLSSLEKRAAAAKAVNEKLEKRLADAERARERYIRGRASSWVKRYAEPAELSEERCGELETLWIGWVRADFGKRPDRETWRAREEALKKRLTSDEATRLAKTVRRGQENYARTSATSFVKHARIDDSRKAAFEGAVLGKLRYPESALLLSAHPEDRVDWFSVYRAVERSVPDLDGILTEEEHGRLKALVEKWKPRPARIQVRPPKKG